MIAEIEFDPIATTYKEFCYNQEIKFNIKNMLKGDGTLQKYNKHL